MILLLLALLTALPLAWVGYNALAQEPQVSTPEEKRIPKLPVPNLVGMTLDEAEREVGDDFEIRVKSSVEDVEDVNTILGQTPKGGEAEKGSTLSVTIVGTQVAEVPDVVGTESSAAEGTLAGAGLEVEVEERESTAENEGMVVAQEPGGGARVEVGSEVTIAVGTGPAMVEVPELYGITPAQAAGLLQEAGLELGAQSEDYSEEVPEGGIFYQDPAEGESVEAGSRVNVTVSLGPEQVEVPEVYGANLAEAQRLVGGAGLDSTVLEVESQEEAGTALYTDPPAGTLLDPGTTVTIFYSSGPPEPAPAPEPTVAPDASAPSEPQDPPEVESEDPNADQVGNPGRGVGAGAPANGGQGNGGRGNGAAPRQQTPPAREGRGGGGQG